MIITWSSSGIGEATAKHLAGLGAKVVLAARRLDKLESIATAIKASGREVIIAQTDVAKQADVDALISKALAAFGRIDVMVHNAGHMSIAPMV